MCVSIGALFTALCTSQAAALTLSFQQGASGYAGTADTTLLEGKPTALRGDSQLIQWDLWNQYGSGAEEIGLLRFGSIFDTNGGPVPQGSQITSAILTYTTHNAAFGARGEVYEATVDWTEAVTFNEFGGAASPGVQPGEYGVFVVEAPTPVTEVTINVTDSLVRWSANPADNKGWIIFATSSDLAAIYSSEHPVISERPKLTLVIEEGPPTGELSRHPYLQLATPDSMTIVWETDLPSDSLVHYGASPSTLSQSASNATVDTFHQITLTNLSPATTYYYDAGTSTRVLAGGDPEHHFVTPPVGSTAPVHAWVVGDSGTGGARQAEVFSAMLAEAGTDEPDLILHMGDMAYGDGSHVAFTDNFFTPYRNLLRRAVTWPTIGAHELVSSNAWNETGPYFESFVLPAGGEAGGVPSGSEAYYSFDVGNVHFMSLSYAHGSGSPMYAWAAADAAATQQDWLIAFISHPPYSKSNHDSDVEVPMIRVREELLPILEGAGVDLVLSGHSHIYERSFLLDGAYGTPTSALGHLVDDGDGSSTGDGAYSKPAGRRPHRGTVYVVSGSGGISLFGPGGHSVMFFDEVEWGSGLLSIDGLTLSFRHVRRDGVISDSFEIVKVPQVPALAPGLRATLAALLVIAAARGLRTRPTPSARLPRVEQRA